MRSVSGRRGRVGLVLAPLAPLLALGCSFPDVNVVGGSDDTAAPFDSGGGSLVGPTDSASPAFDGSLTDDGEVDATVPDGGGDAPLSPPDAQPLDTGVTVDATPPPDATTPPVDAAPAVNCNCLAIQMYPVNVAGCGLLGTGLAACMPGGFTGNPPCGTAGEFTTCTASVLQCLKGTTTKVQQCM